MLLAEPVTAQAPCEFKCRFGTFALWEAQRRLENRGRLVRLGPRSFELLVQFLKRPGEIISQDELLAAVWSGVVVGETSVRVHMSNLRKALGKPGLQEDCREWIVTIPLRGYRFVGRVCRQAEEPEPSSLEANLALAVLRCAAPARPGFAARFAG